MTEKNKSIGNFPNLRFPGFQGEWKTATLGGLGNIITGSTPATNEPTFYNGNHLFVSPVDIQTNRYIFKTKTTLTDKGFNKGRKIRKGSTYFVCIGSTIGKVGQATQDSITNQQINSIIPFGNDDDFVFSLLEYSSFRIKSLSAEQAVPIINKTTFSNVIVIIPDIEEQKKISSFFKLVDAKIQTQKKIIEDTCKIKLNFSHNLFTQKLKINQQYISKWEEKNLGDISTILMGQSPDSSAYNVYKNGLPLIQGNADIIQRFSVPRQFTSQVTKTCDIGDIILTVRAPVGYVAKSKHFACIGRGVCAIKNNEKSDSEFIYQFLLYFENKWSAFEQGSTFTSVNSADIKAIKIDIPTINEQRDIAQLLKTFDEKITLEKELLTQYKKQKKFLLQNLFV